MPDLEVRQHRGWDVVRLRSSGLQADIVPGKGGDLLSLVWLPRNLELLWQSPWGLRHRGSLPTGGDSVASLMEAYPGGWQTVFPNGGDPVVAHGVEWGMHGEAWLAGYDWTPTGPASIELVTRLVRSPFRLTRRITLLDDAIAISETVTNEGLEPLEVMWGHHPALGAPLLSGAAVLDISAVTLAADDVRTTPHGDLLPGGVGEWPYLPGRDGGLIDLSILPSENDRLDRFAYATRLTEGLATVTNRSLGIHVRLEWDAAALPYAWIWLEAHGSPGFPWYQGVYVLAVEPCTSWPGQGLDACRQKTGTLLAVLPGESRTVSISLRVQTL